MAAIRTAATAQTRTGEREAISTSTPTKRLGSNPLQRSPVLPTFVVASPTPKEPALPKRLNNGPYCVHRDDLCPPTHAQCVILLTEDPPHTRGWTRGRGHVAGLTVGSPAHAGMDPQRSRAIVQRLSLDCGVTRCGPNAVQKRLRRTVSEAVVIDQRVYTVPRHDAFPGNSACHSTRVLSRSPRDLRSVSRPAIGRSDSAASGRNQRPRR